MKRLPMRAAGRERAYADLRAGLLFWVLLIFAVGFARYFFLAHRDGDGELAVAAAVAFVLMCVLAAAEFFGWLW